MAKVLLQLNNLHKSYGAHVVLDGAAAYQRKKELQSEKLDKVNQLLSNP